MSSFWRKLWCCVCGRIKPNFLIEHGLPCSVIKKCSFKRRNPYHVELRQISVWYFGWPNQRQRPSVVLSICKKKRINVNSHFALILKKACLTSRNIVLKFPLTPGCIGFWWERFSLLTTNQLDHLFDLTCTSGIIFSGCVLNLGILIREQWL